MYGPEDTVGISSLDVLLDPPSHGFLSVGSSEHERHQQCLSIKRICEREDFQVEYEWGSGYDSDLCPVLSCVVTVL